MKHTGLSLAVGALLFALLVGLPARAFATDPLVIGVFPRRDAVLTMKLFKPLGDYLQQALGQPVVLETATDFTAFERRVREGRYDVIHCNQYQYVQAHAQVGYDVLAQNEEFGESEIRGALYTRTDSGLQAINDLKGKTILFGGGETAMMSYIVPTFLLRQAGLMDGDYTEQFASSPPNAVLAAFLGHVDAAGAGEVVRRLPVVTEKIDVAQLRVIAVSDAMAHLPWAVHPRVPPDVREPLRNALVSLNETPQGRDVLRSARLTGLKPATDADYSPLRSMIEVVQGNGALKR